MICRIRAKDSARTILVEGIVGTDDVMTVENNWYFKLDRINVDLLVRTDRLYNCPYKGEAVWYDLQLPGKLVKNVAWHYSDPMAGFERIADRVAFYARETSGTIPEEIEDTASS